MNFRVDINDKEIFPIIRLENINENVVAEIYSFGALLNAFNISNSVNIIDGFSSPQYAKDNITKGFKSAKLSPYVCRITNGKYGFNGQQYSIGKFFLGNEAIHGLLYDAVFDIVDSGANTDAAFAKLEHRYNKKNEGFPFDYTCVVTYTLEKNKRLSIETFVKNNSETSMPVCDGWHPYFKLNAKIDELFFQLNTNKMLEFNERLVPTGKINSYDKFQQLEILSNTFLDNCFLLSEFDKPVCILKNISSGLELAIHPDKSYPYLQVYTPEHRKSIAIENLSGAPDSFNNKIGLTILKPSESCSFKTSYSISMKS